MSPLILVGILSLSTLITADVKHLLQHQPYQLNDISPQDINYLAHSGANSFAASSSYSGASSGAFGANSGASSGSFGANLGAFGGGFAGAHAGAGGYSGAGASSGSYSSSGALSGSNSGSGAGSGSYAGAGVSSGSQSGSGAGSGSYSGSGGTSGFTTGANTGSYGSNSGESEGAVKGNGQFWWNQPNSPFKYAYEQTKKCMLKGNCAPNFVVANNVQSGGCAGGCGGSVAVPIVPTIPVPNIDIKKNPFFNGNFQGISISSCTGTACKNGKPHETVVTSCQGSECKTNVVEGAPSYPSNPFLNGGSSSFVVSGGSNTGFAGSNNASPDYSKNPYLNGQSGSSGAAAGSASGSASGSGSIGGSGSFASSGSYSGSGNIGSGNTVTSGNGAQIEVGDGKGFLGVQPSPPFAGSKKPFASKHPVSGGAELSLNQGAQPFPVNRPGEFGDNNKKPFSTSYPGQVSGGAGLSVGSSGASGQEGALKGGNECNGEGYICVRSEQCEDGVVKQGYQDLYQAASKVSV